MKYVLQFLIAVIITIAYTVKYWENPSKIPWLEVISVFLVTFISLLGAVITQSLFSKRKIYEIEYYPGTKSERK